MWPNLGMLAAGGAVLAVGAFLFGTSHVSADAVRTAERMTFTVIENTWERENVAVDREINLYTQQIMDRKSMLELIDLVEKLDTVTGEAREALRAELKRRDEAVRAAQAEADRRADELRAYKSKWGDAPVPDGYICRMRGETACEAPSGGIGAAPPAGDGVALRDRGR